MLNYFRYDFFAYRQAQTWPSVDEIKGLEVNPEDIQKTLESWDLDGINQLGIGVSRALGFGPEFDIFVTGIICLLALVLIVGFIANPKQPDSTDKKE